MTLSMRIKSEGSKTGLTLSAIEKKLKLGQGTIRRWDKNSPSIKKVYMVANLLNVSLDYLYTGQQDNIKLHKPALDDNENNILDLYRTLNQDYKDIILGDLRKYNTLQKHESAVVAASPPVKKQA